MKEYLSEFRVVKLDAVNHADFHFYAICQLFYDLEGNFMFLSDPEELSRLSILDLEKFITSDVQKALFKPHLVESDLLSGNFKLKDENKSRLS